MNYHYYARELHDPKTDKSRGTAKLSPTRDHVHPKSRGGKRTVWACRQCNGLKADLAPHAWWRFVDSNPRYWKEFRTHGDVQRWLRDNARQKRVKRPVAPRFPAGLVPMPPLCRGLLASGPHGGAD